MGNLERIRLQSPAAHGSRKGRARASPRRVLHFLNPRCCPPRRALPAEATHGAIAQPADELTEGDLSRCKWGVMTTSLCCVRSRCREPRRQRAAPSDGGGRRQQLFFGWMMHS